ncbi:MAG: Periplasmic sensor signal transduction histidine kinase precursor, partial [candidate division NC10 bacterium]|nr:Periplasmic sensor signal transduction histidine kinase precursor [candidate division NC10 bacterium]
MRGKLLAMMFGLLLLVLAILFGLYWHAERQLIAQVERHTTELSTAIQISVEQLTSKGRTSEARLQDYVQHLQRRGVEEISIVSNEEEVIASSNPRRVGVRVDPKRKDILITARLGEEAVGG